MNINWRVRIKNKDFWITLIPLIILLIQAVAAVFNYTIDLGDLGNKILKVVNIAFAILGVIGIVNDPTTESFSDSKLAMTYDEPKIKGV